MLRVSICTYIYISQGYALCRRPPECILGLLAAGLWGCWALGLLAERLWDCYLVVFGCYWLPRGSHLAAYGLYLAVVWLPRGSHLLA